MADTFRAIFGSPSVHSLRTFGEIIRPYIPTSYQYHEPSSHCVLVLSRLPVRVTYARKRQAERAQNTVPPWSSPLKALPPEMDNLTLPQMARRMLKRSRPVENMSDRLVPEWPSLAPARKHPSPRTSSRNLGENNARSQPPASPFRDCPTPPKAKGSGRPCRRALRGPLRAKLPTLSGILEENARRALPNDTTASSIDKNEESDARYIKHRPYPPSPSALRSHYNETSSPGGSAYTDASFYTRHPQYRSTPAISRVRRVPGPNGHENRTHDTISNSTGPSIATIGGSGAMTQAGSFIAEYSVPLANEVGSPAAVLTLGVPAARPPAAHSGSASESDDELLLKGPWIEDLVDQAPVRNVQHTRARTAFGPTRRWKHALDVRRLTATLSTAESKSDDELLLKGPWVED